MKNFSSKKMLNPIQLVLGVLIAVLFFTRLGGVRGEKKVSLREVLSGKDGSPEGERLAVLAQNKENPQKFLFAGCSGFF